MTDINKYKSVALKHQTYEKLKVISTNVIDIDLSLAQTITYITDMFYAQVTSDGWVKPMKGSIEYQKFKKKLLFPKHANVVKLNEVSSKTLNQQG